ncbi:PQQ-dependent sugar dehydrogenase [Desertibaculum subflavum]|uniref:PQQ-dependent sugar dehydrogenase n=1 Tax=Desertibaculum subflavum TaxID=2268458 RepID=UPI000E66E961
MQRCPIQRCLSLVAVALLLAAVAAEAKEREIDSRAGRLRVTQIAKDLEHPWSLAFLPDGRMLVTERPGRLRVVTAEGKLSEPLRGLPRIFAQGQGGLHDVTLDPDFASNRRVYLAFAEPGEGGASTAVARGRLGDGAVEDMQVIFRQLPKVDGPNHFGGRLVFAPDGTLFVTTGERFKFDPAQDLRSHLGKLIRINPDGSVPRDNPFVGRPDARPEIWSYGHRNIQGAAINPATGVLWLHEHGPRGGDELNIPQPGKNYGWPLVSWGRHYGGTSIPDPPTRPDLAGSVRHWTPVIAPSGMAFCTTDLLPGWKGNVLIGGLVFDGIVRLTLDGDKVTGEERISLGTRIRDVRQGPDGAIYVLTDDSDGEILRLTAAARR